MRLLNTSTLVFEEFFDSSCPDYAILSHRWEGKETTLQELEASKPQKIQHCSSGVAKIKTFAATANFHGHSWCWVDTCCIDKKGSAELSEAIDSMWNWYAKAKVCYAYLNDVSIDQEPVKEEHLRNSAWFTRGWTLQEMLAPKSLHFFDTEWSQIGSRNEPTMQTILTAVTGIDFRFFGDIDAIHSATVLERMRWISQRQTSRAEDLSYCMLGIFGVQMPLLYGEGEGAFLRLQSEIMKVTDDETIFAWIQPGLEKSGLFANHPKMFANKNPNEDTGKGLRICRAVGFVRSPISLTSKGVELEIWAKPREISDNTINVLLNCRWEGRDRHIALDLEKLEDAIYRRVHCERLLGVRADSAANSAFNSHSFDDLQFQRRSLQRSAILRVASPPWETRMNAPTMQDANEPRRVKIYVRQKDVA